MENLAIELFPNSEPSSQELGPSSTPELYQFDDLAPSSRTSHQAASISSLKALLRPGAETVPAGPFDQGRTNSALDLAMIARRAGRIAARQTSQFDVRNTERERAELIRRKYRQGLSPGEEKTLKLLEWKLERFEDTQIGDTLDGLEQLVELKKKFLDELQSVVSRTRPRQNGE